MPDQWIYEPVISDFDMRLLYQALLQYKGSYFYYPIAVAKRKEIGNKYHFLCIAKQKTCPVSYSLFIVVEVYKPAKGHPYISHMHHISQDQMDSRF